MPVKKEKVTSTLTNFLSLVSIHHNSNKHKTSLITLERKGENLPRLHQSEERQLQALTRQLRI